LVSPVAAEPCATNSVIQLGPHLLGVKGERHLLLKWFQKIDQIAVAGVDIGFTIEEPVLKGGRDSWS